MGIFHFSDEALKGAGRGAANHDLTNTCAATLRRCSEEGNKVARSGRKIDQNEVPKPGPQNRQFCGDAWAYPHGRKHAVDHA